MSDTGRTAPSDQPVLGIDGLREYVSRFNDSDPGLDDTSIDNGQSFRFLIENVPRFDCPDPCMMETYYFRWWTYRKHVKHTPEGYVVTEFLPAVEWSGRYNTINCAVGHHLYEGRWLRDRKILDDYIRFHFRGGGDPGAVSKRYSNWIMDGIYARFLVNADRAFPVELLDDFIANFEAWKSAGPTNDPWSEGRRLECGLYWQIDSWEGQEYSIGGTGARVPINAYMFGETAALGRIAGLAGESGLSSTYREEAERLRAFVQGELWDPRAAFFKTLRHGDAPTDQYANHAAERCEPGRLVGVREIFGYTPWYFGLPESGRGFEEAWLQLTDPEGFLGSFGPTVAERRHPNFQINESGCRWCGASWPFSTSQTLTALANLLNGCEQSVIGREEYFALLSTYAGSHRHTAGGVTVPWIDESLDPDTGRWITNGAPHPATRGRYYNHSTFCDLIISGLVGLRPQADEVLEVNPLVPPGTWEYFCLDNVAYHGHEVTILWDRTGGRYGRGTGMRIMCDGREIGVSEGIRRVRIDLTPIQANSRAAPPSDHGQCH